jgi:hypothetical protein
LAGWYYNSVVTPAECQSPTLSPQIPDYFGANTVTGTVFPCQPSNCVGCKDDYLICILCEAGYDVASGLCQLPITPGSETPEAIP